jgi:mannose-1-phosphate guanylyltransferase
MISKNIIPIILCGGSGSRLWPLSRESYPKQYISLSSKNEHSLLQNTVKRLQVLKNIINPVMICNEDHRFLVAEQLREINIIPNSILLEPEGKNTAPAIALSAIKALEIEEDPILLVLSSDHEINNEKKFKEVVEVGLDFANQNKLVTFGVVPSKPETGFGYIKAEKPFIRNKIEGQNIEEFIEKPNLSTAKEYLKDMRFTWNSGIFMFKAKTIIEEMNLFFPEIIKICKECLDNSERDLDFQRLHKESFIKCPNISIDVAVMEKTNKGIVLPLDAEWSDVGSWQAVWENANKDKKGNSVIGNIILKDTNNSYLRSEKRLMVGIGLNDIVAIETNDAILISNKNKSQDVKEVVNLLKKNSVPEGNKHRKIYRPWGYYESIIEDSRWQVKLIKVKPSEQLSLQMHHHRAEHWIVVKGTAKVEVNNKVEFLTENQSTYIPLGSKHRLSNPGKIPLLLIEVQSGSYVGEDDIIRFDDKYGR